MAIVVTNPTAASKWKKGTEYLITWTGGGTTFPTSIKLYKGGDYLQDIYSEEVESQYLWTPGTGLTTGNDYQIYVEYYSQSGYSDEFLIYSAFVVQLDDGLGLGDSMDKALTKIFSDNLSLSDSIYRDVEVGVVNPTVTTQAVTSIEETTATGNGSITNDGGDSGAIRGMCWDTSSNPTTSDSHATNGTGEGAYTVGLTGLFSGMKYYVRAYSINSAGTSYGSEVTFTTKPAIVVTNPISTSKWKKGADYIITWTGGGAEIEYVKLYKSAVEIEIIGTAFANTQKEFFWTPGAELTTGNDYLIKISDGIDTAWSDEFLIYSAFVVQLNDGLGLGDSMSKAPEKVLSDDLSLSDAVLRFIGRVLLDNLNLSDSIVKQIVKVLSDNLNLSDSMVKQINKVLSDNLTLDDSLSRFIGRELSDDLTLGDLIVKQIDKVFSDNLTLDDSFLRSILRPLSDNLTINDAIIKQINKVLSDNLTLDDSFLRNILRPLSDNLTLSDSIIKQINKVLSDNLTLDDSFLRSISRPLLDNLTISDTIIKQINKILSDNLNLSDSIVKQITKTLSDNLTLDDSIIKQITKVLSDNLTLDDNIIKQITKVLSDNLTLGDSIVKQIDKVLSDNLTLGDSFLRSILRLLFDNLTLDDSFVRSITRPYLVYDTMRDSWYEFYINRDYIGESSGAIIQGVSLTAGDTLENSNLLLQEYYNSGIKQDINVYPTSEMDTDTEARIRTKDFYYEKGVLRRVYLSYEKDDEGNDDASIRTVVKTENVATTTKTHNIANIKNNVWRGVANSKSRGRDFSIIVYNADIIRYVEADYKIRIRSA